MAMPSGRFFGWVIGGTLPGGAGRRLAGQRLGPERRRCGTRPPAPPPPRRRRRAGCSTCSGCPPGRGGRLRHRRRRWPTSPAWPRPATQVLRRAGWDVDRLGLAGGPEVRRARRRRAARHASTWRCATSASARPTPVAADDQGRVEPAALAAALARRPTGPTIVLLQAGNLHSGAFDPFGEAIALAHEHGAWVHVDGAFGLWAAASPRAAAPGRRASPAPTRGPPTRTRPSTCPYDCGVASSRDPAALRAAMGDAGDYLVRDAAGDPLRQGPRAVATGPGGAGVGGAAVARPLRGRRPGRPARRARPRRSPTGVAAVPGAEVLNDVVFTQVCVAFGDDERTRAVTARLLADGDGLDVRLALARPRRPAGLGEQLVDRRGRRRRVGRRRTPGRGRLTTKLGHQPAPVCSPSRNSSSSRTTRSNVRSISGVAVVASTSRPTEASQIS